MDNTDFELDLLNFMKEEQSPVGATYLSEKLHKPPATIGRILYDLEQNGYLAKVSNKGRSITRTGANYLEQQSAMHSKFSTARKIISFVEDTSKEKLLEILVIRKQLEGKAIELACINATDEEIRNLDAIMLEHVYEIRRGGLGNQQDLALHLAIAKMSRNTTLYQVLKLLLTDENAYTKFSSVSSDITHCQLKQHDKLVEAIQQRNSALAVSAMIEHLDQVTSDVQRYY